MSARGMTERARRAVREVEEVLARAGTDEARTMADALRRALLRAEFDAAQTAAMPSPPAARGAAAWAAS